MKPFLIASLAAAGFAEGLPPDANQEGYISENESQVFNNILDRSLPFTLAGHSSHKSHGSHQSHGSHRSSATKRYTPAPTPSYTPTAPSTPKTPPNSSRNNNNTPPKTPPNSNRNNNSTPPKSILPSSPSLDPKTLHGNSNQFGRLVIRAQMILYAQGFYSGEINGLETVETRVALAKYQIANGLAVTSRLDDATVKTMNVDLD